MSDLRKGLFGLLAAAVLVAAIPAAAVAQTERELPVRDEPVVGDEVRGDSFERSKAHVIRQIERRLEALDRLTGQVGSAKYITEAHAASLLRDVAATRETLRTGLAAIRATTTPEQLREIAPPIFQDTLVFALLGPKIHQVVASDAVVAIGDRFSAFGAKLHEALDRIASETDIDTAGAQKNLDEMARLVNAAVSSGGPVTGIVIGLQPSDWPDPAQAALREGKAALGDARGLLREARSLALEVVRFLRSVKDQANG